MFRVGSEAGTDTEPGFPTGATGIIYRRISDISLSAGHAVARSDALTFERDGTNGGIRINNAASPNNPYQLLYCQGISSAAAPSTS